MSLISKWSTIANDNGTLGSTPFYWPEGQAPSTVNDCARQMMATIRTQWNDAQWFDWGFTTSRVSGNSFTVVTSSANTTSVGAAYQTGGRIRVHDTANTIYGTITTVSSSALSVQVTFTPDSGSLTSTASAVYNSIITADQKSLPSGSVPADVVRQSGAQIYGVDSGSTDAYAITLTPTLNSYVAGQSFNFKANTANTGAATLNINSLGATSIVYPNGAALNDNAIPAGAIAHVVYDGTNFQLINTSASGGGGGGTGELKSQTILASGSGTYTVPAGINTILVELVGGGGAGGGATSTGTSASAGGGGGAGGYSRKLITTAPFATFAYSVGVGGTANAGASGSNGTDTTFGTLTGSHGLGGSGGSSTNTTQTWAGGNGGAASGGDINTSGNGGTFGIYANNPNGGNGGGSYFAGGPAGQLATPGVNNPGITGSAKGAGGSGASISSVVAGSTAGGGGSDGIILIYEYS